MITEKIPVSFLRTINLFKDLSFTELEEIKQKLNVQQFHKGQLIFSEEDKCKSIIIVYSGRLKIFRLSLEGREQVLEILDSGDTCACNPGKMDWRCSTSAQAITDGIFLYLNRNDYVTLVNSNHKIMNQLNAIFANRLCNFCALIEQLSLNGSHKRLLKFLVDMAKEEHDEEFGQVGKVRLTQSEISQRLGMVRETVSRQLGSLKKEGLIAIRPCCIVLLDPQRLNVLYSRQS